jgi:hypothetical protein
MSVSFFDAEAGWSAVGPVTLAAREQPSVSTTAAAAAAAAEPLHVALQLLHY